VKPTAKRFFHLGLVAVFASLLGPAIRLHAGDPIPDVDVILEQVPGGVLQIVVRPPVSLQGRRPRRAGPLGGIDRLAVVVGVEDDGALGVGYPRRGRDGAAPQAGDE